MNNSNNLEVVRMGLYLGGVGSGDKRLNLSECKRKYGIDYLVDDEEVDSKYFFRNIVSIYLDVVGKKEDIKEFVINEMYFDLFDSREEEELEFENEWNDRNGIGFNYILF